jgi:cytochrome c6
MLRLLDRGLTVLCTVAAALVIVLLLAGPSLIGAKKSSAAAVSVPGSPVSGASVFASAGCTGCHTLRAAGATGQIGPNLDQLRPSADAVSSIVRSGGGSMPSFSGKLNGAQITAVATYVSSVAGK